MNDLKIFEEVSIECDEKGTAAYAGGHSHGTVGLLDRNGTPIPFSDYQALDATVCEARIRAARAVLGDRLAILVHHYQRDDVYKFADFTGDSFKLSRQASESGAEYVVFCGVHFMAESADILSRPDQIVILPDLSAGCSMADMADIDQVEDCWDSLARALGGDPAARVMPVTYMNSSADLKAFCGERGGIVCTSTNARAVLEWAFARREKVLFFPDQHLGRNTARAMGISLDEMALWSPSARGGGIEPQALDRARVILWEGHCSVHNIFRAEHVDRIRAARPGIRILVHPECRMEVVDVADVVGSTEMIVRTVRESPAGSEWAIGTEIHLVNRLKDHHPDKGVHFLSPTVCMCATMYRIDMPHLAWALDNLVAGHVVNRIRVADETRRWARIALDRMLAVP
ncbi:MAG TPA: quinolinate synthase NadA [Gemmatimonadota bacterium]|nr:quinolinate synthase NadA [Gemmatimonadota bacterium]